MLKENKVLENLLRFGRKVIPRPIFNFFQPFYHFLLGFLAVILFGFPSKRLKVIGVTGTKGKSTVVYLISKILEGAGHKTALISSIEFKIGNKTWLNPLKMTMPGRFKIQKFIREAINQDCKYMILEVTSEGIKQHRHKFIDFDGVVFTNLEKEHIEVHKGFENYKKAKGKLFKSLRKSKKKDKFVVINSDDKHGEYYAELAGSAKQYPYSLKDLDKINLQISLIGEFNKYNALAAIKTGEALGISPEKSLGILKNVKGLPGRMELVIENPFRVYVDYAHTPDSLIKVYETVKSEIRNPKSEMICVLGSCGGGRDKWKRPEMGKIAGEYCDKIMLTNEDPYDENPASIIEDIKAGFSKSQITSNKLQTILDRREAINRALSIAKKDDIVIITGKGSESWICIENGKKTPWDDRKVVREEYKKIYD